MAKIESMVEQGCSELSERYGTPNMRDAIRTGIRWGIEDGQPVYVSDEGSKLVGYCAWLRMPLSPDGMVTGLGTWVHPDYRQLGISEELRKTASDYWRCHGGKYVTGVVAAGNEAGRESACSMGFRVVGFDLRMDL